MTNLQSEQFIQPATAGHIDVINTESVTSFVSMLGFFCEYRSIIHNCFILIASRIMWSNSLTRAAGVNISSQHEG